MRARFFLVAVWLLPVSAAAPTPVPTGYSETLLAGGLNRPVAITILPDGRILIAEQYTGIIRLYMNGINPTLIVNNLPTLGINHNGGGIGIGPDGYLYVAVGENGSAAIDAQNTSRLRGKILRYNLDGSVPSGANANPFDNAVWSYGHRHPFRFTWQPGTDKLFCTENGPNVDDEINKIDPGNNYGWPDDTGPNLNSAYTDPIFNLEPPPAITDIMFYQGSSMPFTGDMFFVEYSTGRIRRLQLGGTNGEQVIAGPIDFVTGISQVVDVEEGLNGEIYYCTLGGKFYKADVISGTNQAPSASFTVTPIRCTLS